MNSKVKRLLLFSSLLVLFIMVPVFAQPGSEEDPLVSKKYVDGQIDELLEMIGRLEEDNGQPEEYREDGPEDDGWEAPPAAVELPPEIRGELLAETLAGFENVYGDMLRQAAGNVSGGNGEYPLQPPPAEASLFEVVFAESGSVIYFDSSAEVILRGGFAAVVSGPDGICDVTSGVDLVNGQEVPYNHLLIVPVGDGRGVQVYNDAYFMVKGGYYFG